MIPHTTLASLFAAGMLLTAVATAGEPQAAAATAQAPEEHFAVFEYRVLGNTLLPVADIERGVYPFLGPDKSVADVESARQSLENAYRAAGFGTVFVDTPEQDIEGGVVRLHVTEGKLDRVRISGARYFSNGRIRAALPALQPGSVPRIADIQEELAALNRVTRDRSIVPVLRAGRTPGTVDVDLRVQDTLPLHASIDVNDRRTANTSRLRVNGSVSFDNLFQRQQSLALQYQTAPQETDDVQAIVASYMFHLERLPQSTFVVYAVDSQSDVAALGTLSVIGNGRIFGARAIQSLAESAAASHSLTLGLDYKDFDENIVLADATVSTPIRYVNWSLAWTGTFRGERSSSGLNFAANFGMRGVVNDSGEFADKRFKASPGYFYVRGGGQYARFVGTQLQVFGRLAAQYSPSPLVSNEQFAAGGADSVRGYFESAQLGDLGVSSTVELRWIGLSQWLALQPGAAYVHVFFDAASIAINDPLPSQASRFELASSGAGLRVEGWHGLGVSLEWARALTGVGGVSRGDDRALFSLRYGF